MASPQTSPPPRATTAHSELLGDGRGDVSGGGLGYKPRDVSAEKCGYDIESRIPNTGRLRFIEVKGRIAGATTVTLTRNEILTALNKPDDFVLAVVEIDAEIARSHGTSAGRSTASPISELPV